jgi:hypothetical protein
MKAKNEPSELWKKTVARMRRELIRDKGATLRRDKLKDRNGDIVGYENHQAVIDVELVGCDWRLIVATDNLTGLSFGTFEGLGTGPDGEAYAHFKGRGPLRWVTSGDTPITETERLARELKLHREAPTAPTQPAKGTPPRQAVTLEDAARIVGRTSRTVQNWENGKVTRPEGYPGRGDPVELGAWVSRRKRQADTKRAVANIVRVGDVDRFSKRDKQYNEWQDGMKRRAAPLKQDDADED